MEIALSAAAVLGISLIAVPRLRRRGRRGVRPDATKQWAATAAARRRPVAAAAAGGAGGFGAEPYDDWDDDLGWGDTAVTESAPHGDTAPAPTVAAPGATDDAP